MMNKLKFLVSMSLKKKIQTKWFVVANVIFAVLIVGLINMDTIISMFGGDFNDKQIIYVKDNTNLAYDMINEQNEAYTNLVNDDEAAFEVKKTEDSSDKIFQNEDNKDVWYLEIDYDDENYIRASLISNDYISSIDYAQINSIVNNVKTSIALSMSNIDVDELNKISAPITIDRQILDESKGSEEENSQMIMSTVFPFIILPFFALTIFLVQMVGAEINDEKTTRGMEIIISNVSPKVHFFSKVIASNLFVLIQGALLVIFVILGILLRMTLGNGFDMSGLDLGIDLSSILTPELLNQLAYVIPLALILMILTFVAYSLLAGILASMTTNIEDFQQLQMPIVIISLVGYYLGMMAPIFEGSLFIKIFAFVPFISAILAPSLLVLGQIGVFEVVIAILLLILVIFLLVKYGLKIYKVGILNYSSKGLWKKMFKALKE